jgi:hypothetical protein
MLTTSTRSTRQSASLPVGAFRFALCALLLAALALSGFYAAHPASAAAPQAAPANQPNGQGPAPAIIATPSSGLVTTEAGGTATFTVQLSTVPTAQVQITISSLNINEGLIITPDSCGIGFTGKNCAIGATAAGPDPQPQAQSPVTTFYFDSNNWNVPQTVTLVGVDDSWTDGDTPYNILLNPTGSSDQVYGTLPVVYVEATNLDNEVAGIIATPSSGLVTTEAGGQTTFTVQLAAPPLGVALVEVSSLNPAEGTVSVPPPCLIPVQGNDRNQVCPPTVQVGKNTVPITSTLIFFTYNWNVPQTVTVTGVDDAILDGDQAYNIQLKTTCCDLAYTALPPVLVGVTNLDNEVPGNVTVTPTGGLTTTAASPTVQITMDLNTPPPGDVSIPLSSSDSAKGTPSTGAVTFTPADWNVPQTVTVTGNSAHPGVFTIITGPATSPDPLYNGVNPADVVITNLAAPKKGSKTPAALYANLRVSPDREYGVNSTDFLTYSFEVNKSGPGEAGGVSLRLPFDANLQPAASSFSNPAAWVQQIVTDGAQPYALISLPNLPAGGVVTGTISFIAGPEAQPGTTIFTRAWVSWSDGTASNRSRGTNAVRFELVGGATNRNDTGGEVQFFSQVGEPTGTTLNLEGDFYAPNEVVSLWYTPGSGESVALGNATADLNGHLSFTVDYQGWPAGEPISVAGRGNQSGVTGSAVITLTAATGAPLTLRNPNQAELQAIQNAGF